jgi:hypothetical protein
MLLPNMHPLVHLLKSVHMFISCFPKLDLLLLCNQ